ncbi:DNA primase [Pseudoxanthomonas sp. LH2527]|uniref:DNA primase n=1 Tax=Pseudoxanthomonas sp. LH2527 TaxID=2923249 RepID=UPI001F12DBC5|nr:DNA primase [Pseudoxanthomonas sp. LH2527]MCH6482897.1 DNA primase [Pseudoxanthomonas sp. LH2527]
MARIPDAFIDELLARTDIVEVVGGRVPLKRQGKEYSACCPFHDERSPSFTVSPTKQFYHCFGCGAHGTALSFLMNYDRLEFLDAVEELARRTGMEVPRETQQRNENNDTRDLFNALEAAARFFQRNLDGSDKAKAYLDGRGVDAAIRTQFMIGYAPDGYSALKDALGTDERRMKLLDRAGLFSKNDRGHVYDKFRDRVMFPIHDRRGRVIAFGGRVLQKDDGPKYLNSPETALFHKGRELYGLWQVKQANQKIARLVVVEGYMDVVSLFQFGVKEAVATLGTATTPEHAELLFRNAPDVYFCFDGDAAGQRAAWRALESVLPRMKDGRQAFFLFLPDGEDPDTIVRQEGAEGFDARLQQATPLSQFFFDELAKDIKLSTLDGKARLAERARPLLAQIPDGAFGDLMRQRLTEITGVGASNANATPTAPTPARRAAPSQAGQKPSLVRSLIVRLLHKPALALSIESTHGFSALRLAGMDLLLELITLVHARPDITTGVLLEHFAEREEATALQKLAMQALPGDEDSWRMEVLDAAVQLEKQMLQQRLDELQAKQRSMGLDETDKYELRTLLQARIGRH